MVLKKEDRQELFLTVLRASFGNISAACEMADVGRSTVSNWLKEDRFAEQVDEVREFVLDVAESKLMENILANSSRDIHFLLNAKGKSRGYGTGPNVEDPDARPRLASPNYPPEPQSLADWEAQVREARDGGDGANPGGAPRLLEETTGPDGHPDR